MRLDKIVAFIKKKIVSVERYYNLLNNCITSLTLRIKFITSAIFMTRAQLFTIIDDSLSVLTSAQFYSYFISLINKILSCTGNRDVFSILYFLIDPIMLKLESFLKNKNKFPNVAPQGLGYPFWIVYRNFRVIKKTDAVYFLTDVILALNFIHEYLFSLRQGLKIKYGHTEVYNFLISLNRAWVNVVETCVNRLVLNRLIYMLYRVNLREAGTSVYFYTIMYVVTRLNFLSDLYVHFLQGALTFFYSIFLFLFKDSFVPAAIKKCRLFFFSLPVFLVLYLFFLFILDMLDQLVFFYYANNVYTYITITGAPYLLFFFFFIYFFCIFLCFFFMLFLSLRGIFILTNLSLLFFWFSLILNLKTFFFFNNKINCVLFKWFKLNEHTQIFFELYIDNISYSFMLLTTTIALFVNFYSFSYFKNELNVEKFILFLNSFVLSMLLLVSAGNLIILFLGWELIGITSFFLINFWFTRATTFKSAFKAFSFNKLSDCCILFSVLLLTGVSKTVSFTSILNSAFLLNELKLNSVYNISTLELVSASFLVAAFIKSAQIGFHIWLPDSMEAPVPASALIHSATLVSAGIFLILRLYPLFELSSCFFFFISLIGASTAFVGGISAAMQTDLKKILAYSTISHCGFLVFLTAFNHVGYILLYLFIHGFFKASAFLSVGNIIKFAKGYQDIRRMGQFWKYLPADFFFLTFSLLNLSGLPFFFGFYIKHFLFLSMDYLAFKLICSVLLFLAALSGIFYSFRIIYYVFFDFKKARKSVYFNSVTHYSNHEFYTNSTVASHLAIVGLFLCSYGISYIFLYYYFSNNFLGADQNSFILKLTDMFFFSSNQSLFFNFKFLNWIILILFLFLIFFKWKKYFLYEVVLETFYFFTVSVFFLSILNYFLI